MSVFNYSVQQGCVPITNKEIGIEFSLLCDYTVNNSLNNVAGTTPTLGFVQFPVWHVAFFGFLAAVVSLVTVTGNLVVILSFVFERSIRQPTNYFIASLAVSDLLIGSTSMPFYTIYLLSGQHWLLGEGLCDLWLSIDYTACLCSIYTVCTIMKVGLLD